MFTRMKSAPVTAAMDRAAWASFRSTLMPMGRDVTCFTRSTAKVMADTVSGSTEPMRNGTSQKFSTMTP